MKNGEPDAGVEQEPNGREGARHGKDPLRHGPGGMVVGDLAMFAYTVTPQTRLGSVVDELQETTTLPGVILLEGSQVVGVLPRSTILEHLSRPFGHELFLPRPASTLLQHVDRPVLRLSGSTTVQDAAARALRRPTDHVFDPVLVEDPDNGPQLLDVHTLLLAQSRLLAEANQTIQKQRDLAEAANEAKSQFLANMSHEIRTPLTAVLGFAETILEPDTDEREARRSARVIQRNGEHLLRVINDILDLSKIEAGRLEVETIRMPVLPIIADVVNAMSVRAQSKGIQLSVVLDPPLPRYVTSDPTRFQQILLNLVGNAIKFTEQGEVRINVRFDDPAGGSGLLVITVADTGIGMTEDQSDRLFQPFSQADVSMARRFGGTGLGLSISRRLARMLGGDISVHSVLNQGSRFTLTVTAGMDAALEMLDDPEAEFASLQSGEVGEGARTVHIRGRVLLADDGPDNRLLISTMLRKWGADVTTCADGLEAVQCALSEQDAGRPFDCILMDMQMPEMDGYAATRALRAADYQGPVIAITANAMASDRDLCLRAGCDDYATKPIHRARLASQIGRFVQTVDVDAGAAAEAVRRPEPSVARTTQDVPLDVSGVFVLETALERTGGDRNLLTQLLQLFLGHIDGWLAELSRAKSESNTATFRRLAHSVKNSAETLGGPRLVQAALTLERAAAESSSIDDGDWNTFQSEVARFTTALRDVHELQTTRMEQSC